MVGFGKSILQARRECWTQAYLDYQALKDVVNQLEFCFTDRRSLDFRFSPRREEAFIEHERIHALKIKFFSLLKEEIEKMSLFILQQQGQVADAVGALRFASSTPGLFDQKNRLLPISEDDVGLTAITFPDNNLDKYAALGVELLHLLKFITINSIGIGKILKKYNKVFERLDLPCQYFVTGEHLQQLAFSPSIRAIESSLHSALTESFASLSTATTVNHLSSAGLQVTRLQCVMSCSDRLQRNAEILQRPFLEFLSQKAMIATGSHLGGMGDSGKRALKWLIRLRPDDLLTMSEEQLEDLWNRWSDGPTAAKQIEQERSSPAPPRSFKSLRDLQEAETEDERAEGQIPHLVEVKNWMWGGVNAASMTLNLLSVLLYTVNYYIVAPTANHYAIKLGTDGAYGSTLIGASSFAALFAAFFYSFWYTKASFKSALMFSAFSPMVGNLIYALAISFDSMAVAILGRIICGFGSAEVINRQLIAACVDFEGMTKASAFFVAASAIGMSVGPLLAGVLEITTGRDTDVDIPVPFLPSGGIVFDHVTSPGFLMSFLWFLQLVALFFIFQEPRRINGSADSTMASHSLDNLDSGDAEDQDEDEEGVLARQVGNGYGAVSTWVEGMDNVRGKSLSWLDEAAITASLVFENPGLPVTILLFGYIEMADEVLISSCSMVVRRYFGWNGSAAGFFIASLGALVLPAHLFVERASHLYSERNILMKSLLFIVMSCLGILNWSGLVDDVAGIFYETLEDKGRHRPRIGDEDVGSLLNAAGEFPYDYGSGPTVYIAFLSAIFIGTIVLEGVDTSLMAKGTPPKLNDRFFNCGLLATVVGTLGRVIADSMITLSALLDIHVFVDFVNATFLPVLFLALVGMYLARRYYKRLV